MSMEQYKNEIWRPIEGYENYVVSNCGTVKNLVTNNIVGYLHPTNKRYQVGFHIKGKMKFIETHLLVAKAFPEICGEWFEGCEVHHKDFNKLNNRADNLIVLTKEEHNKLHLKYNIERGILANGMKGKHHSEETKKKISNALKGKESKLKKSVVMLNSYGDILNMFKSISEAKKETGIKHISECCNGERKTAGGYIWKYFF